MPVKYTLPGSRPITKLHYSYINLIKTYFPFVIFFCFNSCSLLKMNCILFLYTLLEKNLFLELSGVKLSQKILLWEHYPNSHFRLYTGRPHVKRWSLMELFPCSFLPHWFFYCLNFQNIQNFREHRK